MIIIDNYENISIGSKTFIIISISLLIVKIWIRIIE